MNHREYFTDSSRKVVACCSDCSSTWEFDGPVERAKLTGVGFTLVDGAWTGLCTPCKEKRIDASNAEYEALVRATAELGRVAIVGPLTTIEIPTAEGFDREGEKHFGCWTVSNEFTDVGFERFVSMAEAIVANINRNRGTELLLNLNGSRTQAILHGIVD